MRIIDADDVFAAILLASDQPSILRLIANAEKSPTITSRMIAIHFVSVRMTMRIASAISLALVGSLTASSDDISCNYQQDTTNILLSEKAKYITRISSLSD
jgi:hypothetical protein